MSGSKPIPEFVYVYGFLGSSYSLFRKQMAKVTKKLECRICRGGGTGEAGEATASAEIRG